MRTTVAGSLAASLLAVFAFLGAEPVSWPRAAVLIAGCLSLAALGIFAHDHRPAPTQAPPAALPAKDEEPAPVVKP